MESSFLSKKKMNEIRSLGYTAFSTEGNSQGRAS